MDAPDEFWPALNRILKQIEDNINNIREYRYIFVNNILIIYNIIRINHIFNIRN